MSENFAESLHSFLKERTRDSHRRLDRNSMLRSLLDNGLTESVYGDVLQAMYAFYAAVEPQILAYLERSALPFDYRERVKLPLLANDLSRLDRKPVPPVETMPDLIQDAELIAALYVLEGATLGGQMIVKSLTSKHAGLPVEFYTGYGTFTQQRWREFWLFAEVYCPQSDWCVAGDYAVSLFALLESRLSGE
ncbi:biliverdin-producing heme oxygenase [Methylotuvimicrobium alcaliphilum]|uniref:Heme oxygenase n=1 Tax=Methylotuvimicrobium alcaliphilum (strain DSM 19304 / NCIMB 14124 / VKM B-2133 / 20Z) TaxID=1091494 RepID=G4T395_META2|nr:biliverdin-producing heme oxygenase [Methylotuvimicrobium alcaliphilum]CCE22587.1 putative heme oxygenase [Methylotuvimicrobium alcaliphilum 20Z]